MDIEKVLEKVRECYGRYSSIILYSDGSGHISVENAISKDGEVVVFTFYNLDELEEI